MPIRIKTDVYFTDHNNEENIISDKIIDMEIFEEVGKPYQTLSIKVGNVYFDPSLARDKIERIRVEIFAYDISENMEKLRSESYMIDSMAYGKNKIATVVAKTKGALCEEAFSGLSSGEIFGSMHNVANQLIPSVSITAQNHALSENMISFEYKSKISILLELLEITGSEVYYKYGNIACIDNKKEIIKDAVFSFNSSDHIISISSTTKSDGKVGGLMINSTGVQEVHCEPSITLAIDRSPQPLSPSALVVYTSEETTYKISPCSAQGTIYYSPLTSIPSITIQGISPRRHIDYAVIEKYSLDNEYFFYTTAGIKNIIGLSLNGVITLATYSLNQNIVFFSEKVTGDVIISYNTDVFRFTLPPSSTQGKKISINATHLNHVLKHTHEYQPEGYYPLPYAIKMSLVSDWGFDSEDAIFASGNVVKIDAEGIRTIVGSWSADAFGEVPVLLLNYGVYVLACQGHDDLYIKMYINEFSMDLNPIVANENIIEVEAPIVNVNECAYFPLPMIGSSTNRCNGSVAYTVNQSGSIFIPN